VLVVAAGVVVENKPGVVLVTGAVDVVTTGVVLV
jgi:hypothetical protein